MTVPRALIVGGGASGFFAAITCAEAMPDAEVLIFEKSHRPLSKVRISGGGRCNVTHACEDVRQLCARYPRGEGALIGPFHQFQPRDTVEWFSMRGVDLKAESDGRMFPVTNHSETIVDCLERAARAAGVKTHVNASVKGIVKREEGRFEVTSSHADLLVCDVVLLATGGCRSLADGHMPVSLGHTLVEPVPSLFTFNIETPWIRQLSGVTVNDAIVSVPAVGLRERGPVLLTHWGMSGPAVLKLSAWGARHLHGMGYHFPLFVQWLPDQDATSLEREIARRRETQPAKRVVTVPIAPLTGRLWEALVGAAGIGVETRWASLSAFARHQLVGQLLRTELPVSGKSTNKDEFVTCGGVPLREVNFKTMESRVCSGLYLTGELLDIDGVTGGFNFQAAWTTGWIAGKAMAEALAKRAGGGWNQTTHRPA